MAGFGQRAAGAAGRVVGRVARMGRKRDPEGRMPVMDHLREFRSRVVKILVIITIGAVIGWFFYNPILRVLQDPYCAIEYGHRLGGASGDDDTCKLYFTDPLGGFTTRLKVSFIAGMIITGPLWLYQIWAFVTPGLRRNERKYTIIFMAASTTLFVAGVALAYAVLAKGLEILVTAAGEGTAAALTVDKYLSFVTLMLLIFGASFELPLLVVMLNFVGVLPARLLRKSQRTAFFLIFLFCAIATPSTDPFTMVAMALPMCVLFEAAVIIASIHDRRKAKRPLPSYEDDEAPSEIDPIPKPLTEWSDTT